MAHNCLYCEQPDVLPFFPPVSKWLHLFCIVINRENVLFCFLLHVVSHAFPQESTLPVKLLLSNHVIFS